MFYRLTRYLLFSLCMMVAVVNANANETKDIVAAMEQRNVKRDCQMEGEGEGLQNEALDRFVKGCVRDLMELEFSTSQPLKGDGL